MLARAELHLDVGLGSSGMVGRNVLEKTPGYLIGLGSVLAFLSATCGGSGSSSNPTTGAASGESCRSRADCAQGLACIAKVCTLDDSGLVPTGKECVSIECAVSSDCCPEPSSYCQSLEQNCKLGDSYSCQQYQQLCSCQPEHWSCETDHCVELCETSTDCQQGTCVALKCVQCGVDADCPSSMSCKQQKCVPKCTDSTGCPYFHQCIDGGCVETGCANDRECIAVTGNVLALCADTECKVPCESDVQCGLTATDIEACIGGFCVSVGCESDEECRLLLGVQAGKGAEAVCRDKLTP
jgi:hypothetical protein